MRKRVLFIVTPQGECEPELWVRAGTGVMRPDGTEEFHLDVLPTSPDQRIVSRDWVDP